MPSVLFILKKPNALTRLEYFDGQPSWKDLASKITELFNIPSDRVSVAYVNEDKDVVLILSDHDLQSFYKDPRSSEEIKFVVQNEDNPDDAAIIASTWSPIDHEFTLFCCVLNTSDEPFSITIEKNKTVDDLKEAIKKKLEPAFSGIAYNTLMLWKPSPAIPYFQIGEKLGHVQSPEKIAGFVKLDPFDELSEHFTSPTLKHVHIVVQPPIHE